MAFRRRLRCAFLGPITMIGPLTGGSPFQVKIHGTRITTCFSGIDTKVALSFWEGCFCIAVCFMSHSCTRSGFFMGKIMGSNGLF